MAATERSLIAEIEDAFASGPAGKQADILRRVTDLFLAEADSYTDEHVDLFDGVISRLAERIEIKARAELAHRLAPVPNAPPNTVLMLARDQSIDVAGPILSQSSRLTDEDLLAIANDKSQERLLAISKRATISETVSDALVTHGDRNVSDAGYGELIDRSINDEVLAICVATRKDIPRGHFNMLIAKASEVVFEKLSASNPNAVYEVHRILTDITGQNTSPQANQKRDYREAAAKFDVIRRTGAAIDPILLGFASGGMFEETVAALSALSGAPVKLVESVITTGERRTISCSSWRKPPDSLGRPQNRFASCAAGPSACRRPRRRPRAAASSACCRPPPSAWSASTTNVIRRW